MKPFAASSWLCKWCPVQQLPWYIEHYTLGAGLPTGDWSVTVEQPVALMLHLGHAPCTIV